MVHEERLAASRSFEQYSSPISMLLKARCGRFAFACTFVFPTKRFKFARIKSIDNEALLRQLVQSSQKKVPLFFTTDRLVQILDFGDVSTDRQVLSRVTRKVLSNSKHTLLCLCGHNVLERIKPNTIENTSVVSVSLLASIYIEDCLESASHNSYFFVRCKIKR